MSALRDGLRQAKDDLDQARKGREKLIKAKQAVEIEAEKFESQVITVFYILIKLFN